MIDKPHETGGGRSAEIETLVTERFSRQVPFISSRRRNADQLPSLGFLPHSEKSQALPWVWTGTVRNNRTPLRLDTKNSSKSY